MVSFDYIIVVAVLTGSLAPIARFLRLIVEDPEAVEIDVDDLERRESVISTDEFNLTVRKKSPRR